MKKIKNKSLGKKWAAGLIMVALIVFSGCDVLTDPQGIGTTTSSIETSATVADTGSIEPIQNSFEIRFVLADSELLEIYYAMDRNTALSDEELSLPTPELIELIFTRENVVIFGKLFTALGVDSGIRPVTDDYGRTFIIPGFNYYASWRTYNGIAELENRPDAAACLLEKYKTAETDDCFGEFQTPCEGVNLLMKSLEVMLSEEIYSNQLTEAERAALYKTLEVFYGEDRSKAPTDGSDQSYRFYPYYPAS